MHSIRIDYKMLMMSHLNNEPGKNTTNLKELEHSLSLLQPIKVNTVGLEMWKYRNVFLPSIIARSAVSGRCHIVIREFARMSVTRECHVWRYCAGGSAAESIRSAQRTYLHDSSMCGHCDFHLM